MLFQFNAEAEAVKEFERRLRVSDLVIKFLTVRIDETLKRLEKRKKERDKRARRKSAAVPPALAMVVFICSMKASTSSSGASGFAINSSS